MRMDHLGKRDKQDLHNFWRVNLFRNMQETIFYNVKNLKEIEVLFINHFFITKFRDFLFVAFRTVLKVYAKVILLHNASF